MARLVHWAVKSSKEKPEIKKQQLMQQNQKQKLSPRTQKSHQIQFEKQPQSFASNYQPFIDRLESNKPNFSLQHTQSQNQMQFQFSSKKPKKAYQESPYQQFLKPYQHLPQYISSPHLDALISTKPLQKQMSKKQEVFQKQSQQSNIRAEKSVSVERESRKSSLFSIPIEPFMDNRDQAESYPNYQKNFDLENFQKESFRDGGFEEYEENFSPEISYFNKETSFSKFQKNYLEQQQNQLIQQQKPMIVEQRNFDYSASQEQLIQNQHLNETLDIKFESLKQSIMESFEYRMKNILNETIKYVHDINRPHFSETSPFQTSDNFMLQQTHRSENQPASYQAFSNQNTNLHQMSPQIKVLRPAKTLNQQFQIYHPSSLQEDVNACYEYIPGCDNEESEKEKDQDSHENKIDGQMFTQL